LARGRGALGPRLRDPRGRQGDRGGCARPPADADAGRVGLRHPARRSRHEDARRGAWSGHGRPRVILTSGATATALVAVVVLAIGVAGGRPDLAVLSVPALLTVLWAGLTRARGPGTLEVR